MNFINLFLSKQQTVTVKNNNLHVKGEGEFTFPLSDIGVVMIENTRCMVSAHALSRLCEGGATVFLCDEKHLPTAQLLPCNAYYRPLMRLSQQMELTKPRQKNLWKHIIKAKIQNQKQALVLANKPCKRLEELLLSVRSGDEGNAEAVAAAYYFPTMFGENFTRESDTVTNAALNYGYAIVRGLVARQIVAHGFLPSLGIWHHNQFNAFNLADDLIEPFRPIIDRFIYAHRQEIGEEFNAQAKKIVFSLVNLEVLSGESRHILPNAVQRFIESVVAYYGGKDELCLPSIYASGTVEHEYE